VVLALVAPLIALVALQALFGVPAGSCVDRLLNPSAALTPSPARGEGAIAAGPRAYRR
jgi:hypothetical protein